MRFFTRLRGRKEAYFFTIGFSIYHKVIIVEEYKRKTTFTTKWGSFTYNVMPDKAK